MPFANPKNHPAFIVTLMASATGLALVHCSSQNPETQPGPKVLRTIEGAVEIRDVERTDKDILAEEPATIATATSEEVDNQAIRLSMPKPAKAKEDKVAKGELEKRRAEPVKPSAGRLAQYEAMPMACPPPTQQWTDQPSAPPAEDQESYAAIQENGFQSVAQHPLSTFSIDVDNASYANMRRFLNQGQLPPSDAIRIEEWINYFPYPYPKPEGKDPISLTMDMAQTPWNPKSNLVLIGLKAREMASEKLPPQNLTFLIDVSGSMQDLNRLPLLKKAFGLLVDQLRPQDHVALVVYAGAAGVVLNPTSGEHKAEIRAALERLEAGGSTAGGAGLRLAYQVARESFQKGGNNRVLIATDGDFNVGESSDGAMEKLIVHERESGIFLSVLGFGMGNYKDSKMETLADKGNGNYAYIDNLLEARKVFVEQLGGTLQTVAKDVKLQVEWNPERVSSYRLIGYENRLLRDEDFNDDTKDAGEMGAGHTVTALYEIIPVGVEPSLPRVDPLRYGQNPKPVRMDEANSHKRTQPWDELSEEVMTVKFRYKAPQGTQSQLFSQSLKSQLDRNLNQASETLRFTAAVSGFGMLLRQSPYAANITLNQMIELASKAKAFDPQGYRAECLRLMQLAQSLTAHSEVSVRD